LVLREMKLEKAGENCIITSFIARMIHKTILRSQNQGGWDWLGCSMHVRDKKGTHNFISKRRGRNLIERSKRTLEKNKL
jgi:hypothetical protein